MTKPLLLVIVGPTAVGKTTVGIEIAKRLNGEIISVDSRQIYRSMEIGSGAPTSSELEQVPHHLISVFEPDELVSAGTYARLAHEKISDVHAKGKLPVVVGGSGLYIRALVDGLAPIPKPDMKLRSEISRRIDDQGMEYMIRELTRIDPEYAVNVGIKNRKRLIRALEVWYATGKNLSQWHWESQKNEKYSPLFFGLDRPRFELHQIIEERIRSMVESGWLEEVKSLISSYKGIDHLPLTVLQGLGYKYLINYILGEISLEVAKEKTIFSTRQFAKRQLTWFRADERVLWREESGKGAEIRWADWIITHVRSLLPTCIRTYN